MNRLLAVTAVSILAALSACQRQAPAVAAAASPAAANTPDDSLKTLTRAAFPEWKGGDAVVLEVPSYNRPNERTTVAATPTLVVPVDATHRALVLVGTPADDEGHENASHAEGGNLGVYGFELRDGHWVKTTTQDSVLWSGSSGALGEVKQVDLSPGRPALAVEGGWTGQGYDVGGLDLVALEPAGARVVLADVRLHSDSLGLIDGCGEWLNKNVPPSAQVQADLTPENCFDVDSTWHVEPHAGAQRGDIVITFDGHRLAVDAKTAAKTVQAVTGTLVYRYGKSGYEKASGENLAPEV